TVNIWDVATGRELLTLEGLFEQWGIADLAFSPDGRQVAATTAVERNDQRPTPLRPVVLVWDATTGQRLHRLPLPATPDRLEFRALEYTADSKRLVAAVSSKSGPGTVAVWDATSGKAVHTLTAGPGSRMTTTPRLVGVSREGSRIACGDD